MGRKEYGMTVIQRTIRIPESYQIMLDLPRDLPVGDTADIVVTVAQSQKEGVRRESILNLAGALSESKTFAGDSVALIREIRDEW
jgi:hypothetical protein